MSRRKEERQQHKDTGAPENEAEDERRDVPNVSEEGDGLGHGFSLA